MVVTANDRVSVIKGAPIVVNIGTPTTSVRMEPDLGYTQVSLSDAYQVVPYAKRVTMDFELPASITQGLFVDVDRLEQALLDEIGDREIAIVGATLYAKTYADGVAAQVYTNINAAYIGSMIGNTYVLAADLSTMGIAFNTGTGLTTATLQEIYTRSVRVDNNQASYDTNLQAVVTNNAALLTRTEVLEVSVDGASGVKARLATVEGAAAGMFTVWYGAPQELLIGMVKFVDSVTVALRTSALAVQDSDVQYQYLGGVLGSSNDGWVRSDTSASSEVSSLASSTGVSIQSLQDQIDGSLSTYFYGYTPTLTNLPASEWAAIDKANHVGDLFYDKTTGYGYRFAYEDIIDTPDAGIVYSWIRITDTDITTALANASNAQHTADGKATIYYGDTTPTPKIENGITIPIEVGDLWVHATTKVTKIAITIIPSIIWGDTTNTATENALLSLADLEEARDGSVIVFYLTTTTAATGMTYGDYLVDTDSWNEVVYNVYRYQNATGGSTGILSWVLSTGDTAKTLSSGYRAQILAGTAQITADGKVKTYYLAYGLRPVLTAADTGDMLVATDENNAMYTWSGTEWVTTSNTRTNVAYGWAAGASKLITAPDGSVTGWSFGDSSNTKSEFKIKAQNFSISDGVTGYTPFSIEGSQISFNGTVNINKLASSMYIGEYVNPPGPTITIGTTVYTIKLGDTYKNTSNNIVYQYTSTGWSSTAGANGTNGTNGIAGINGTDGANGIAGIDGVNGVTTYTWVKYASDSTGTGITDFPTGMTYLGMAYNKTTSVESTVKTDYTWSLIKGTDGIAGTNGINGTTMYTWIKYADTNTGTGISDSPVGKLYIGIAVNKTTATESLTTTDYTWSLIKGLDGINGTNGISGTNGIDGVTTYTWVKYAKDVNGGSINDNPLDATYTYLGLAYNKTTSVESVNPVDYTWSLIKGQNGVDGFNGSDGIPGVNGTNGITYYTWIKYASDSVGSVMSNDPAGKLYIGIAVNKLSAVESAVATDYTWALIKGTDGINGINGIAGTNGTNGTTYYTWIKYGTDANGAGMSDFSAGKTYLGIAYNKTVAEESLNAVDYTWSLIKGADGVAGTNGSNGIPGTNGTDGVTTYTWIMYGDDSVGTGISNIAGTKPYIGIAVNKTTATESVTPADYTWSLIKGTDGTNGTNGSNGTTGARGAISAFSSTLGTLTPTDAQLAAVINAIADPDGCIVGDNVTFTVSGTSGGTKTSYCTVAGNPGTWTRADLFVNGNAVINGTLAANKLIMNTGWAGKIYNSAATSSLDATMIIDFDAGSIYIR